MNMYYYSTTAAALTRAPILSSCIAVVFTFSSPQSFLFNLSAFWLQYCRLIIESDGPVIAFECLIRWKCLKYACLFVRIDVVIIKYQLCKFTIIKLKPVQVFGPPPKKTFQFVSSLKRQILGLFISCIDIIWLLY